MTLSKTSSSSPSMLVVMPVEGAGAGLRKREAQERAARTARAVRRQSSVHAQPSRFPPHASLAQQPSTLSFSPSPTAMVRSWSWLPFCSLFFAASTAVAYEVPIADTDYDRQVCSGMWGGQNTYINGMALIYATLRAKSANHRPQLRSTLPHMVSWPLLYTNGEM